MSLIVTLLSMIVSQFIPFLLSHDVRAEQSFSSSAIPFAVRSPYLNGWLQGGPVGSAVGPTTFNTSQILGWSVLVRVDGLTYSLFGDVLPNVHNDTVTFTNTVMTPTQAVITAQAGPMQVNLIFLNPIEPQDWVKQSIPFSYLAFTANSLDGASHAVQVCSDVSGEWNSGDRTQKLLWSTTSNVDVVFHSVTLQTQVQFMEATDQAKWGTLYFGTQAGDDVTHQIGLDTDSRSNFISNGVLNGQQEQDTAMRPVFAISCDLGTIKATQNPVVWTIGYTTDPAISYTDLSGAPPTSRSPYYKTQYPNDDKLIVDFLTDYSSALTRARNLDNTILQAANSVSNNLGDLVSASIAQVFGSMQLTIGTDTYGDLNQSDLMMFMKNIGGAKKNRVNAVETLYAAFPALMFINSSFGGYLLEPLFRLQASSNYTIPYAAADLGSNYPNVAGSNSNHSQGVEQTANMLIMTYAHARASGDGRFIKGHYKLLSSWADYLNASTLFISNQASADNLSVSNQTNLAIKGIIAIAAMSKMSAVVKQTDDENKYSNAASRLYAQWKGLALSSDQHILAVYGQSNSWTLGYNLFADVWLGTKLVESLIYVGHSDFIHNLVLTSNFSTFGMPIDSLDTNVAVSSWSLFAAAMTSNQGLCSDLITKVFNRANNPTILGVMPEYYDSRSGVALQGVASPAIGAALAISALEVPVQINANGTTPPPPPKPNKAAIVGGIIGGVVFIALIVIAVVIVRRQRQRRDRLTVLPSDSEEFNSADADLQVTPFDPNSYSSEESTRGSRNLTGPRQRPLIATENPEGEIPLHRLSSQISTPPTVHARPRPVAPVQGGKGMARLRKGALTSGSQQQSHNPLTPNAPQPLANAVTESGEATRTIDSPPSYTEGNG